MYTIMIMQKKDSSVYVSDTAVPQFNNGTWLIQSQTLDYPNCSEATLYYENYCTCNFQDGGSLAALWQL